MAAGTTPKCCNHCATMTKYSGWLNGSKLSFRIVELSSADAPVAVTSYGTFPGEDRKYFCSFCGASGAKGTPLMIGPVGNIRPRCVRGYASWATEQSGDS